MKKFLIRRFVLIYAPLTVIGAGVMIASFVQRIPHMAYLAGFAVAFIAILAAVADTIQAVDDL